MPPGSILGNVVVRKEDPSLLRGRGTFTANLDLDGVLCGVFVRSLVAHALISKVDISEAESMPGVEAVFTAADMGVDAFLSLGASNPAFARPPLAGRAGPLRRRPHRPRDCLHLHRGRRRRRGRLRGLRAPCRWPSTRRRRWRRRRGPALRRRGRQHRPERHRPGRRRLLRGRRRGRQGPLRQPAHGRGADGAQRLRGRARSRCARRPEAVGGQPDAPRPPLRHRPDPRHGPGHGPGHRPQCRRRLRGQDRRLPRVRGHRGGGRAAATTGALGRDPFREHGRPEPRTGPGPLGGDGLHRRGPDHRAPAARAGRRRRLSGHRGGAGRRADAHALPGRLRDPEDRLRLGGGGDQHHAGRGVSGRRPARGDLPSSSGSWTWPRWSWTSTRPSCAAATSSPTMPFPTPPARA